MKFPNAYKGIKNIFTAEILAVVGILLLGIAAMSGAVAVAGAAAGEEGVALASIGGLAVAGLGGSIVIIVGFILNLVGLSQASKDEQQYIKTAFILTIVGLVCSVISAFIGNATVVNIFRTISDVAGIIAILYVCKGIMVLAEQLGNQDIAAFADKVQWLIVIVYAVGIIVGLLPLSTAAGVIAIIAMILKIISVVIYLMLLARAKNMLKE